jgi:hypothetical protein
MSRFASAVTVSSTINTHNNNNGNGIDNGNDDRMASSTSHGRRCCNGSRCQWLMRNVRLHLRSFIAFNGAIIFWTGLWDVLDLYMVGDATPLRDSIYSIVGLGLLLATNTFFVTVGIDQELLRSGRARYCANQWRGPSRLICRSIGSLAGSVAFWVGIYNLFDQHWYEPTVTYDVTCFFVSLVALAATSTLLGDYHIHNLP